jgi:hypothetical protein
MNCEFAFNEVYFSSSSTKSVLFLSAFEEAALIGLAFLMLLLFKIKNV